MNLTFSGCHATALTALLPELLRVRDSLFVFTSQTVTNPLLPPVARMWGIFLFQSTESRSSDLDVRLPRRNGDSMLLRSQTYIYEKMEKDQGHPCFSLCFFSELSQQKYMSHLAFCTTGKKQFRFEGVELERFDRPRVLCR